MAVDINKFWIEGLLLGAYPRFLEDKGVDFDADGSIHGKEVFGDLDQDGTVGDRGDYELYLENNRAPLSKAIPFFKWGEKLSVRNRIHRIFYLLSDLHSDSHVESAYVFITDIVKTLNGSFGKGELSPQTESQLYYTMINSAGIVFKVQDDSSLVGNIKKGRLDCDTSGFVAMAVGDERGVKLQPVRTPGHAFLRGRDKKGKEFNIDFGTITTDESYKVDQDLVNRKVYLATLDDRGLKAMFLGNRGVVLEKLGRNEDALAAYNKAIEIDPKYALAHNNRGVVLEKLGRNEDALAAYDKAIEIDPKYALAHNNRGNVLGKLGRNEDALAAYDKAIEIDPGDADAHYNRGVVLKELGKYNEALAAFDKAIEIDPGDADAHYNRGVVLEKLGRNEDALAAYDKAIVLDPKYTRAHYNRGVVLEKLGRNEDAPNE